jgi:hypothetical protein
LSAAEPRTVPPEPAVQNERCVIVSVAVRSPPDHVSGAELASTWLAADAHVTCLRVVEVAAAVVPALPGSAVWSFACTAALAVYVVRPHQASSILFASPTAIGMLSGSAPTVDRSISTGPAAARGYDDWMDLYNGALEQLIGKTMRSVVQNGRDSIDFEAESGERWRMFYDPDCCASCYIEDVVGDLQDLVGSPVAMAEAVTNHDDPLTADEESFTWTFYKLASAKGYVTIRWYGRSNGYYSETASFQRLAE